MELNKLGHQVKVIALDYRNSLVETLRFDNLEITSYPTKTLGSTLLLPLSVSQIEKCKPNIIIGSGHINIGYFAQKIAMKLQVDFVFDLYDDYSTFPEARFFPGISAIQSLLIQRSSKTIVVSEKLKERLNLKKNVLVIENGVDTSVFKPTDQAVARKQLNISNNKIVIGYFGSLGKLLGTPLLLEAISKLRKQMPNIILLLAGKNSQNYDSNSDFVEYLGLLPQSQIPGLIAACDIVVIPYPKSPQYSVSTACKIPEYLACRVPVVCTRIANYSSYFRNSSNTLCNPGDLNDLISKIKLQLEKREICPFPIELEWSNLTKKFNDFLI